MAVTKIWAIKDSLSRVVDYAANPQKTIYSDLQKAIHYAENEGKTNQEEACYVTGVNCHADTAFEEMQSVQERFGKVTGNVAYHAYQSFKTGEITPEQCHNIGVQLAKDMWGTDYQVLVATHFNTGTYHNHFVINSVNMWTGKKFNCNKKAYSKFRELSDEICRQQQLTVIENPTSKTARPIYFAEKNGEPTKYNLMREAIDFALSICATQKDFYRVMKRQGYIVNFNPDLKYATIRSVNDKRNTRLYRLGEEYDRGHIFQRLRTNKDKFTADELKILKDGANQIKEIEGKLTILEQKYPGCGSKPSEGESVDAESAGMVSDNSELTKFPSFKGKDLDGNDVNSDDIFSSNNVTVINFWFTTCNPCVGELGDLEKLNKELAEKGGTVMGINSFTLDGDKTAISEAKDVLTKKGITYKNVWFDSNSEAGKFASGLYSYPTTYVVDKNGNIVGQPIVGAITS